jgi:hypothetical protein
MMKGGEILLFLPPERGRKMRSTAFKVGEVG